MPTKILAFLFLFLTTATLTRPRPAFLAVCNKPFFQTDGAQDISHAHGAPYVCVGTWGKYIYPIFSPLYLTPLFPVVPQPVGLGTCAPPKTVRLLYGIFAK